MVTAARIGHGTLFKTGDGATSEVFTSFGEVIGITPPNISVDAIDASQGEPPGGTREFIPGMIDGGEVSIDFNFVPGGAGAAALMAEVASRPTRNRQIVFPDGSYFAFAAFLTGFKPDAKLDDKMTGSATFKVTGLPSLTQA